MIGVFDHYDQYNHNVCHCPYCHNGQKYHLYHNVPDSLVYKDNLIYNYNTIIQKKLVNYKSTFPVYLPLVLIVLRTLVHVKNII